MPVGYLESHPTQEDEGEEETAEVSTVLAAEGAPSVEPSSVLSGTQPAITVANKDAPADQPNVSVAQPAAQDGQTTAVGTPAEASAPPVIGQAPTSSEVDSASGAPGSQSVSQET